MSKDPYGGLLASGYVLYLLNVSGDWQGSGIKYWKRLIRRIGPTSCNRYLASKISVILHSLNKRLTYFMKLKVKLARSTLIHACWCKCQECTQNSSYVCVYLLEQSFT